jgi:2-polyprenyl-3-methyl-5-hydroxy-6-metoxy-1,4-benzoquinol methylase
MIACPICGNRQSRRLLGSTRFATLLFRCPECRIVHWADYWEPDKATEYYHGYYAGKAPTYDPITEKRYHAILERFERLTRKGRLLDAGCGMGHFLAVAESRGWTAVGLEVSGSGVEMLAAIKKERGWRFEVHGEDLLKADFPPRSFKVVTLFEVLEHLGDPLANLRRVHSLLEPGGILYLTTPNFDSLSRHALGERWRAITREHRCLFNPETLRNCLVEAGFDPLELVTKNIDLPEILSKWRTRSRPDVAVATFSATRAFRQTVESSRLLRLGKAGANLALSLLGLGETIEALAVLNTHAHSRDRD